MEGVDIKVYADAALVEAANIALSSRLYVSGWDLSGKLVRVRDQVENDPTAMPHTRITIAFKDGEAIAVALTYRTEYYEHKTQHVQTFVRECHRKKGLGTKCVRALGRHEQLVAAEGIDGSLTFWSKLGVAF